MLYSLKSLNPWRRVLIAIALVSLACMLAPTVVLAQAESTDETCASCHSAEYDAWIASDHGTVHPESVGAIGGASCIDCHGPYVKGHPEDGTILLTVDSSLCQDCHSATYDQWLHTQHAGEGVQCISCHRPHTQDLRLTDETLCQSCHRDSLNDSLHSAHRIGEVKCTSCHMDGYALGNSHVSTVPVGMSEPVATHDFIVVSAQSCLDCHRDDVANTKVRNELVAPDTTVLNAELTAAQRMNKILAAISATNLGLGLGFGGILGIVFMLVAARIFPRRDS